ncbi:hypothetical protein F4802DRAFT_255776 [Xylaria palmicola]|nr:hypothetical protein F4802DRAFT_255776 [Xylaria palmicola]
MNMDPFAQSPSVPVQKPAGRLKPTRLRNACNGCCTAKVKCSGERSGCARCRGTGISCLYLESRAGKVPGIRAKKKQTQHQAPGRQQPSRPRGPGAPTLITCTTSPALGSQDHHARSIMSWAAHESTNIYKDIWGSTPMDGQGSQDNIPTAVNGSQLDSPHGDEYSLCIAPPNLDSFDLVFPASQIPLAGQDGEVRPTSARLMSLGARPRSEVDSQCFLECCYILSDLEHIIKDQVKAPKIVSQVIKQALERITQLVELQQDSKNLRCCMLLDTLMYQVVELFETCLLTAAADKHRLLNGSLAGSASSLGFGDYSMDAEDQLALRNQTIGREVRSAVGILERLKGLAFTRWSSCSPSTHPYPGVNYHDDLQLRLDEISARLARSC